VKLSKQQSLGQVVVYKLNYSIYFTKHFYNDWKQPRVDNVHASNLKVDRGTVDSSKFSFFYETTKQKSNQTRLWKVAYSNAASKGFYWRSFTMEGSQQGRRDSGHKFGCCAPFFCQICFSTVLEVKDCQITSRRKLLILLKFAVYLSHSTQKLSAALTPLILQTCVLINSSTLGQGKC